MQRAVAALLLAGLLLAGCIGAPQGEDLQRGVEPRERVDAAVPAWAAPGEALIKPGVPILTQKRACPSNFVFTKTDNSSVFLGTTAHCVRDLPIGALATVGGPEEIAVLVYSSWQSMAEVGESDPDAHEYNDFAVFRIDSHSRHHVSPHLPEGQGPRAMGDAGSAGLGTRIREMAGSPLAVNGRDAPTWHDGIVTGRVGDWALLVHAATPAMPGYTGGPVIDAEGRALGVVVNLGLAPNPGANGVARLDMLLAYAADHAKLDMALATA